MAQTLEHNQVVTQVVPITVPSCDVDVTVIQQLDDEPNDVGGLTAAELKAKFDETNAAVKSYINDELIPAVVGADATEQARAAAEAERVANEIERVSNETTRVNAEITRGNNETARQGAETTRGNNETTRESNETTRQNNEATRQNNEAARVLAEAARENAETGYVAQCATSAEDAANSATAAGNSATAASNSETAAGNSATAASNSATAAGNSAMNAATSESNAAASKAAASESETAAGNSATAAGNSAMNAATSERNAEASAQDAEAWAVGKRGGVNVGESDPAYHNNALYWKEQAQQAAGTGDMLASTYDPQGKAQDIFAYVEGLATSAKAKLFSVTIPASGWSGNAQTVSNDMFKAAGFGYIYNPDEASYGAYISAMVRCGEVTVDGQVMFYCDDTPTDDITVDFMRIEVNDNV